MAALEAPEDIVEDLVVLDLTVAITAPEQRLPWLPVPCNRRGWRFDRRPRTHVLISAGLVN